MKANFDGAVFANSRVAGVGVVIQNENGEVMAALSEKIAFPSLVHILEMVAARRAAVFAVELDFQRVIFEGDAASVIKALSMRDLALALIGHFVKDFVSIAGSLRTFSFSHTRRQDNNVAHALVRGVSFSFPCKFGWRMFNQIFYIMLLKIFQLIK